MLYMKVTKFYNKGIIMKKFNLSLVTVLAMSTFAIAGGDIAPVEPVVMVEEPVVEDRGFYLGLGYGLLSADREVDFAGTKISRGSEDYSQIVLQAGYKFNSYVALEWRYWGAIDDNTFLDRYDEIERTADVEAWGIYVKPIYPVSDAFDIYALLGYATSDFSGTSVGDLDGFSWGLGAAYNFNENWSVFIDWTELYDNDDTTVLGHNQDTSLDVTTFAFSYKF